MTVEMAKLTLMGDFAMWYVLQTTTGQEEKLVQMIRELVAPELYEDCFVAYYERVWRKQQQSVVHVERLFPGYVFVVTQDPEELFLAKKSSRYVKAGGSRPI